MERKLFDKHLAEKAARAGAAAQSDARLLSLDTDGNDVVSCHLLVQGEKVEVEPKIVIAADGVHSTVSKLLGKELYTSGSVAREIRSRSLATSKKIRAT